MIEHVFVGKKVPVPYVRYNMDKKYCHNCGKFIRHTRHENRRGDDLTQLTNRANSVYCSKECRLQHRKLALKESPGVEDLISKLISPEERNRERLLRNARTREYNKRYLARNKAKRELANLKYTGKWILCPYCSRKRVRRKTKRFSKHLSWCEAHHRPPLTELQKKVREMLRNYKEPSPRSE